jgi:hypothetical protein
MMSVFVAALVASLAMMYPPARGNPAADAGPRSFRGDDAFLGYVQRQTFRFFWDEANPQNGLIRDRSSEEERVGFKAALESICRGARLTDSRQGV